MQQVLQGYLNGIDDVSFAETVKKELHLLPEAMKAMLMLNARYRLVNLFSDNDTNISTGCLHVAGDSLISTSLILIKERYLPF
jgi:hypothetical protein